MLKPKFTFRVSEEFVDDSLLYTAEVQPNGGYSISWSSDDRLKCGRLFYKKQKVQEFIDNGVWRIQEELNGTAEMS